MNVGTGEGGEALGLSTKGPLCCHNAAKAEGTPFPFPYIASQVPKRIEASITHPIREGAPKSRGVIPGTKRTAIQCPGDQDGGLQM